jgi:hypothetical protein
MSSRFRDGNNKQNRTDDDARSYVTGRSQSSNYCPVHIIDKHSEIEDVSDGYSMPYSSNGSNIHNHHRNENKYDDDDISENGLQQRLNDRKRSSNSNGNHNNNDSFYDHNIQ